MTVLLLIFVLQSEDPDKQKESDEQVLKRKIEKATEKGLEYLVKSQNNDGSWGNNMTVGVTGLTCLALMSAGNYTDRGKHSKAVTKGVKYLLSNIREDGYITDDTGSNMYSHAYATLCLIQAYSMSQEDEIKTKVKKAINLLIRCQNKDGGWRYNPTPQDADLSVTVAVLQTLRSARNVGISVPKITIEKGVNYVEKCIRPEGFGYQPGGHVTYALTAAGIVCLNSAGYYISNSKGKIKKALEVSINKLFTNMTNQQLSDSFYLYGNYYASQAMYVFGGDYWIKYFKKIYPDILTKQNSDGSWSDNSYTNSFGTAMSLLVLQVPNEQSPIFQR
ncbi:MAG: terpene cyclase/mutase family protein [Planctomycetes bacterium]|nr:terpene cyclase/mutase family protein [Planctomycetota bacterium]